MAVILCTSEKEPLCIFGHQHDWGDAEHSPERVGHDFTYPGKYWRCKRCLWSHVTKYPGVDEYWKKVPLDYRIDWPKSPTLCITCNIRPRIGRSAECKKCEDNS